MATVYKYSQLKGVLKVGDTVRAVKGKRNPCYKLKNDGSNTRQITVTGDDCFSIDGCIHAYIKDWYLEIVNNKQKIIMTKLNIMMKKFLDKDSQALVKAEFINGDLELTDEGKENLFALLFEDKKKELVALANEKLEEIKEDK